MPRQKSPRTLLLEDQNVVALIEEKVSAALKTQQRELSKLAKECGADKNVLTALKSYARAA
jgi:hypothetical protein